MTCIPVAGPPPPPPSLQEIVARGVVAAPAPTPVTNVVPQILDTPEQLEAARVDIATALAAFRPSATSDALVMAPREIKSEIVFPTAVEDQAAIIAQGTPERSEGEVSCKTARAANRGGGGGGGD